MMTLKKRFYITSILSVILATLSWGYKDANSELPTFLNILVGIVISYMLLFYLFKTGKLKTNWTSSIIKIIVYISGISLLIFGINMANRIDDDQESFWVVNHNIWLTDLFGILLALLIFYIIFSWAFEQWTKIQTLKNDKAKAELELLKTQINPHFFFNTLNNLYSLIKKDPDTAQEYVLKLSDMMRFTIYDGKEETVPLEEEIKYLTNFIELQTARYHKVIDIDFKHRISNKDYPIPPLLFIILLENSFKHGVEKLINQSFIHIELQENDTQILFTIKNNYDPDTHIKSEGIGLENLQDRLNLLYPNGRHKLTISNQNQVYFVTLELYKS
ncbi:sensor histidine kinase [Aquimarina macrocephali]|uniref:sensor histidine kinase n=1 Tax=Aquimarina macrocephali TaxID=666563 RepID=UPI0004B9B427|nr:histidine kinase [Aquimarina macrocephali]